MKDKIEVQTLRDILMSFVRRTKKHVALADEYTGQILLESHPTPGILYTKINYLATIASVNEKEELILVYVEI